MGNVVGRCLIRRRGCCCLLLTLEELPDVDELKQVTFETPMKIYTSDGKLIGEFGEHKRIPVKLEQIPQKMQQAFLAIEDSRFYEHSGIDPLGTYVLLQLL